MPETQIAVLGGGCFWCLEAVLDRVTGVQSVESGYMGGRRANPTYQQVCSGATGHAEVGTGSGELRIREIDGTAVLKNSNGETRIGEVTGDLRVNTANGDILVDVAHAGVNAKTAAGDIRLGEVMRDRVVLETAVGEIEVGIREGSAAWLELNSLTGTVRNSLTPTEGPGGTGDTVEVKAHTYTGDIVIRRA